MRSDHSLHFSRGAGLHGREYLDVYFPHVARGMNRCVRRSSGCRTLKHNLRPIITSTRTVCPTPSMNLAKHTPFCVAGQKPLHEGGCL